MKEKKNGFIAALGLLVLALGLILIPRLGSDEPLPYILVGLGCGAFGHGMGELLARRAAKGAARQIEIEREDERNVAIVNRAKAKAYDVMLYLFGALILALGLMKLPVAVILLLVFAYLFVCGSAVYYRLRYEKEM